MVDFIHGSKSITTRRKSNYEALVRNVGDEDAADNYPFANGYDAFTTALAVGYRYVNSEMLEAYNEGYDSESFAEYRGEKESHPIAKFNFLITNHTQHACAIELLERILSIRVIHARDDEVNSDESPESVWPLVEAVADQGISKLHTAWTADRDFCLDDEYVGLEAFWEEEVAAIAEDFDRHHHSSTSSAIETP